MASSVLPQVDARLTTRFFVDRIEMADANLERAVRRRERRLGRGRRDLELDDTFIVGALGRGAVCFEAHVRAGKVRVSSRSRNGSASASHQGMMPRNASPSTVAKM